MKLAVVGCRGRMGKAVVRLAAQHGFVLVGACDIEDAGLDAGEAAGIGHAGVQIDANVENAVLGADVVIDFSSKNTTSRVARAVVGSRSAWVCGTTGLSETELRTIDEASATVPVLYAANMSLGIQVLAELVRDAVKKLGASFDVEIVETHHKQKADAPSGTAKRLAEAVREARGGLRDVSGRDGLVGARKEDELGMLAIRGGDVIGDHTVHLLGEGERLELTHRATSRDVFAHGALRAAKFLVGKPAGKYTIADVTSARGS